MSVLIITGPAQQFGFGHLTRMHQMGLELKKRKILTQHLTVEADLRVEVPMAYRLVILDRRDTAFNPGLSEESTKIALDNRGPGRDAADHAIDLLPHLEMKPEEYNDALARIILPDHVTADECRSFEATVTLHDTKAAAERAADFSLSAERQSPKGFTKAMKASRRPALYFGQALFEAIYFGLKVQLYPTSDYHERLSIDLYARLLIEPNLLAQVQGNGRRWFCDKIQMILKRNTP